MKHRELQNPQGTIKACLMLDNIFDNIFIFIPIALILVFRILLPRIRQRESQERETQEKAEQRPVFREMYQEESGGLGHWETEKKPVRNIPKKKNVNRQPLVSAVDSKIEDILQTQLPIKKEAPAPGVSTKIPFPENLDYLSPLKRAFVFSEVFSQAKGIRAD